MKPVKNNDSSALHKIVLRTNRYVTVTSSCTGAGVNTDIRLLTCFTVRKKDDLNTDTCTVVFIGDSHCLIFIGDSHCLISI